MRTFEAAAVRIAVKRSQRAGNLNAGHEHLLSWSMRHQYADIDNTFKSYKKWAKRSGLSYA